MGHHMNNISFMVASSRRELGRKVISEESNSSELPRVALLCGPVRGPTNKRGLPGKGELLGPRVRHC